MGLALNFWYNLTKSQKGDLLWNVDLEYIKENATDENILMVITKMDENASLEKIYGDKKRGQTVLKIES